MMKIGDNVMRFFDFVSILFRYYRQHWKLFTASVYGLVSRKLGCEAVIFFFTTKLFCFFVLSECLMTRVPDTLRDITLTKA